MQETQEQALLHVLDAGRERELSTELQVAHTELQVAHGLFKSMFYICP